MPPKIVPMGPPEPRRTPEPAGESLLGPVVPLRTGPSAELVEATKANLRRTGGEDGEEHPEASESTGDGKPENAVEEKPIAKAENKPGESAEWPKKHVIASGDTLSALADSYYGSSKSLPLILKANPQIKDPRAIRVGEVITIPEPPKPVADSSTPRPAEARPSGGSASADGKAAPAESGKTYRVRENDSFFSIAFSELGDGGRWTEIYKLNHELVKDDPKKLRPGMVLKMP
jgi:nucleoid-associated protein YgaU